MLKLLLFLLNFFLFRIFLSLILALDRANLVMLVQLSFLLKLDFAIITCQIVNITLMIVSSTMRLERAVTMSALEVVDFSLMDSHLHFVLEKNTAIVTSKFVFLLQMFIEVLLIHAELLTEFAQTSFLLMDLQFLLVGKLS